tara:strand:+ start:987 stop:1313 length:327 start_codon:yes stop_codon:yes gene_type:complete
MNYNFMSNMQFNITDVIETLKGESINVIDNGDGTVTLQCNISIECNKDDWDQIKDDSPRNGKFLSLLDVPKDDDGGFKSSTTAIGDLLHDINNDIDELNKHFNFEEEN